MAGLAGVQCRGYFIDILYVFTPVMTIKYGGAFMYQLTHTHTHEGEEKYEKRKGG